NDRLRLEFELTRFDLGKIENVVDKLQQVLGAGQDIAEIFLVLRRDRADPAVMHQLGKADDAVERGAQLVGHVSKKLALQPVGFLDAAVLLFQLFAPSADLLLCVLIGDVAKITCEQGWLRSEERRVGKEGGGEWCG